MRCPKFLVGKIYVVKGFPTTMWKQATPSSSPSERKRGKGEGGKRLNPLPFSLSPFPSPHNPHKRIFGLADY
ncbi:MAG: hypothetical protein V7K45_14165 [Nostoc sp.]